MATLDDVYAAFLRADAAGDKETAQTLADYIRTQGVPEATPQDAPSTGFFANLGQGVNSTVRDVELGLGTLGRSEEETRKQSAINKAAIEKANVKTVSWPDVKEAYGKGILPGIGATYGFTRDVVAGSLPAAGPVMAGASAGAGIGAVIPLPGATLLGGALGAIAGGTPQFIGSNVNRRIEEKTPGPLVTPGLVGTSIAESGLESVGLGFALGKSVLTKILGAPIAKSTDAEIIKAAKQTLIRAGVGGAGSGAVAEGAVSVSQSILERAQAGLPLTTPDAYKEYEESLAGGIAGGAGFGAIGGVHGQQSAKKQEQEINARETRHTSGNKPHCTRRS